LPWTPGMTEAGVGFRRQKTSPRINQFSAAKGGQVSYKPATCPGGDSRHKKKTAQRVRAERASGTCGLGKRLFLPQARLFSCRRLVLPAKRCSPPLFFFFNRYDARPWGFGLFMVTTHPPPQPRRLSYPPAKRAWSVRIKISHRGTCRGRSADCVFFL